MMSDIGGSELQLPDHYNSGWRHPQDRSESLIVEPLTELIKRVKTKNKYLSTA